MRKVPLIILFIVCSWNLLFAISGREIIDKSYALPEGETGRIKMIMKITRDGKSSCKEFVITMKKTGKDEKMVLVEFFKPGDIKLLTYMHAIKDDEQWLKLSSGDVKYIAGQEKEKLFVNSNFSFEDMGSRNINDYDYKLIADKKVAGEDCYTVEAVRKSRVAGVYDRLVIFARKSDFFIVRIDFYRDGKFFKYLENRDVKNVNGILTPYKILMMQADETGGTMLNVLEVKYNIPVQDFIFNKDSLK